MKTADTHTTTTPARAQQQADSQPFFQPDREQGFFGSESAVAEPFFSPTNIQPKLKIGAPNDKYEQEADRTADQVVQRLAKPETISPTVDNKTNTSSESTGIQRSAISPLAATQNIQRQEAPELERQAEETEEESIQRKPIFDSPGIGEDQVQRKCANCAAEGKGMVQRMGTTTEEEMPDVQTKCANCEAEEGIQPKRMPAIQRSGDGSLQASSDFSSRLQRSKGGGSPMSSGTRSSMEGAMGADFSGVRVHTGSEAASLSNDIGAQAFTHGSDVYFNEGKYDPGSSSGQHLLAHELTHTVQQRGVDVQRSLLDSLVPEWLIDTIQRFRHKIEFSFPNTIGTEENKAKRVEENSKDVETTLNGEIQGVESQIAAGENQLSEGVNQQFAQIANDLEESKIGQGDVTSVLAGKEEEISPSLRGLSESKLLSEFSGKKRRPVSGNESANCDATLISRIAEEVKAGALSIAENIVGEDTVARVMDFISKHKETISQVAKSIMNGVVEAVKYSYEFTQMLLFPHKLSGKLLMMGVEKIYAKVKGKAVKAIRKLAHGAKEFLVSTLPKLGTVLIGKVNVIKDSIIGAWQKIKSKARMVWDYLPDALTSRVERMVSALNQKALQALAFGKNIRQRIAVRFNQLRAKAASLKNNLQQRLVGLYERAKEKAKVLADKVADKLKRTFSLGQETKQELEKKVQEEEVAKEVALEEGGKTYLDMITGKTCETFGEFAGSCLDKVLPTPGGEDGSAGEIMLSIAADVTIPIEGVPVNIGAGTKIKISKTFAGGQPIYELKLEGTGNLGLKFGVKGGKSSSLQIDLPGGGMFEAWNNLLGKSNSKESDSKSGAKKGADISANAEVGKKVVFELGYQFDPAKDSTNPCSGLAGLSTFLTALGVSFSLPPPFNLLAPVAIYQFNDNLKTMKLSTAEYAKGSLGLGLDGLGSITANGKYESGYSTELVFNEEPGVQSLIISRFIKGGLGGSISFSKIVDIGGGLDGGVEFSVILKYDSIADQIHAVDVAATVDVSLELQYFDKIRDVLPSFIADKLTTTLAPLYDQGVRTKIGVKDKITVENLQDLAITLYHYFSSPDNVNQEGLLSIILDFLIHQGNLKNKFTITLTDTERIAGLSFGFQDGLAGAETSASLDRSVTKVLFEHEFGSNGKREEPAQTEESKTRDDDKDCTKQSEQWALHDTGKNQLLKIDDQIVCDFFNNTKYANFIDYYADVVVPEFKNQLKSGSALLNQAKNDRCPSLEKLIPEPSSESAEYTGSGLGHEARTQIKNLFGISHIADDVFDVGIASLLQLDAVHLGERMIKLIEEDEKFITFQEDVLNEAEEASDHAGDQSKEIYFSKSRAVQLGGERHSDDMGTQLKNFTNPDYMDTWKVAFNRLTWILRTTGISANVRITKDGKIIVIYRIKGDKLDLRPGGKSDIILRSTEKEGGRSQEYNVTTSIMGLIYHDILGGNDEMTVNAAWCREESLSTSKAETKADDKGSKKTKPKETAE